jgi:Asp-tRNA(Asn)/Glu-tRNA(Gln) amidotransferase A subunit family amidase
VGRTTAELHKLSACEAASLIADDRMTSEALVSACLDQIERREGVVGAWQHLDPEYALQQARALDRGPRRGPLHGLPIGVKDLMDTADMPTRYGTPIYEGHRPKADASCVALTRAAGGVVMGKTVIPEFSCYTPGKTANPRNIKHTPGGSSSGSAAAVADFMVPLAFGTQTEGSIIRPAAYCGVVGYKPSFGLICRAGVKTLVDSLDTVGVLARTVPDAALFTAALTDRPNLRVGNASFSQPRVGICRTYEWKEAAPETVEALEFAATQLAAAGAYVDDVQLPGVFSELNAAHVVILKFEVARALAYERHQHSSLFSADFAALMKSCEQCPVEDYDEAIEIARRCRRELATVFANFNVLIAPSAVGEAPEGLGHTGNRIFNRIWSALLVPCVHVPFFKGPRALPVGVQVTGPLGEDARTLTIADWIHNHLAAATGDQPSALALPSRG